MCLNCIREMTEAFAFKQKCERSEKTLLSLLEQVKTIDDNGHAVGNSSKIECQLESIASDYHIKTMPDVENRSCIERRKTGLTAVEQTKLPTHKSKKVSTEETVMDFIAEHTLKFICSHCKANFSSRRSLRLHVNSQKCMQQTYECEICKKVFIKKRYLIRHLQRMHKMAEEVSEDADNKPNLSHRKKYNCNLCPKGL